MARKSIISLSLFLAMCASVTCAMANSTVYTDDLGRIHFLGKDSGSKTLQQSHIYTQRWKWSNVVL